MPGFTYAEGHLFYREACQGPLLLILRGSKASSALHPGELVRFGQRCCAVVADSCVLRQPPEILRAEVANRRQLHPEAVTSWRRAHG